MKKPKRLGNTLAFWAKELEEVRLDDPSSKNTRQKNTSTRTMAADKMLVPPSTEKTTALEKDFLKINVFCHCKMHRHPPHGFKYMESQDSEIIPTIKSYPSGVSQQHKSFVNYIDSAFWKNPLLMMAPATCQLTRQTSHAPSWPHERCFHGWWSNQLSSLHVRQSFQDDFHESRCFSYHSHASTLSGLPLFSGNSSCHCHTGNNMPEKGLQTSSRIPNLAEDHVCPYGLVPIAPMVLKFEKRSDINLVMAWPFHTQIDHAVLTTIDLQISERQFLRWYPTCGRVASRTSHKESIQVVWEATAWTPFLRYLLWEGLHCD